MFYNYKVLHIAFMQGRAGCKQSHLATYNMLTTIFDIWILEQMNGRLTVRIAEKVSLAQSIIRAWTMPCALKTCIVDRL